MNPVHFPEETNVLAKAQPQYRVLPISLKQEGNILRMTCKYELSELELQQIIKTKHIFISQYGDCFHPIYPQVDSPFLVCKVLYKKNEDNTYNFHIPDQDGNENVLVNVPLETAVDEITRYGNVTAEQILFFPKPELGVDGDGNLKMM